MLKVLHNIIEFYKDSDRSLVGYLRDDFTLVSNIYQSKKFKQETNLDIVAETLLRRAYKKDWADYQGMSKHEFEHLFENWFSDINKDDIKYRIINYEEELRRLKMKKIKNKKS